MLILEGVVGLHRTFSFGMCGWNIDFDYYDVEGFSLEINQDHSVVLRLQSNTVFWTLLLTVRATPFLLKDSCP